MGRIRATAIARTPDGRRATIKKTFVEGDRVASEQTPLDEHDTGDVVAGIDERPQRRREWGGGLRSVVLPLMIVAAIVGSIWYLQNRGRGGGDTAGASIVALPAGKNATGKDPAPEKGRAAPDFLLNRVKRADGTDAGGPEQVRLSDLRGKVVVINFWATWCSPCRAEIPELIKAYIAQSGNGLEVLAVDLKEGEGPVRDFAEQFGMPFPVVIDRGGVAETYRVGGSDLPTTFFVDRDGVIREIKFGAMTGDYLREQLAKLLS